MYKLPIQVTLIITLFILSGCNTSDQQQSGQTPAEYNKKANGLVPITPDVNFPAVVNVANLPRVDNNNKPYVAVRTGVRRPDGIIPEEQAAQLRADALNLPPNSNIQVSMSPAITADQVRGGALVPQLLNTFDGPQFFNSTPPDHEFTVGENYVIGVTNGTFEILNKAGVSQGGAVDYDVFFASVPACASGTFDPNAYYDEEEQRYIIGTAGDGVYCFAVSQSEDLSGGGVFNLYGFTTIQLGSDFFDFPHMGVGNEALFMGANMFLTGNGFRADVWAIDKFAAYDGLALPTPIRRTLDSTADTPQPMNINGFEQGTLPVGNTHYFIADRNFNGSTYSLISWEDPFGTNILTNTGFVDLDAFTGVAAGFPIDQPQSGGGGDIQGNDWRPQDAEYRNGSIWMAHTMSCNPGSGTVNCVRWAEIDINDGNGPIVEQAGVIAIDGEYLSFPDVAVNSCDDMTIGFSRTSPSIFPGVAFTGRLGTDPLNQVDNVQIQKAGEVTYTSFEAATPRRWGDYSEAASDPDGIRTWFMGIYSGNIAGSTNWVTSIGEFTTNCSSTNTDFSMTGSNLTQSVCVNPSANLSTITLDLAPLNGFNENVNFAFSPGLPTGFSSPGSFTPGALIPPGSSTIDISVNTMAANGANNFQITGTSATANKSVDVSIFVTNGVPAVSTLLSPADTSTAASSSPTFSWSAVADTADYTIEIATDIGFSAIVYTTTQAGTSLVLPVTLPTNTTHYWRVIANNGCGSGVASATFSFDTPTQVCFSTLTAIPDDTPGGVTTTINFASSGTISGLLVSMDAEHTWVGDLIFSLEHAGTTVDLMDRPGVPASGFGCGTDNVNTIFDDTSINIVEDQCNGSPPAIGPDSLPHEALSGFNGLDSAGNWNLTVSDNAGDDTGSVNEWCLDIITDSVQTYTVSGTVTGATGPVSLLNNGADGQTSTLNDPFSFAAQNDGTEYIVTASGPATQTCTVTGGSDGDGSGTLAGLNVSVTVTCTTDTYTVSGTVTGATGPVSLLNNGADGQTSTLNDPFSFAAQNDGTEYIVTASGPATQTCTVTGGSDGDGSGTLAGLNVSVTVTCILIISTAQNDTETVLEDSTANTVDVLNNDSLINGGSTILSVIQPTNGVVVITNNGTDLSYTPNLNYCNDAVTTDDFTYTLTDGGSTATVSMAVTCVNDEPDFTIEPNVYIKLTDINSPLTENIACQFDMGPDDEDVSQAVNNFIVSIDSDPNGIITTFDVLNDGSISASYSGNQGVANISISLEDNGGTDNNGDDSVTKQFLLNVQDYVFKNDFETEVCPQL